MSPILNEALAKRTLAVSQSVFKALARALGTQSLTNLPNGFYRDIIPNTCPDCYTAEDFTNDHQEGTFVLYLGNHFATVVDGIIYDSWDSSSEIPQYYWYKKEK